MKSRKPKCHLVLNVNIISNILGLIGNTFHTADIDRAIQLGNTYDPDLISQDTQKVLGIDSGFGSSAFGIVLLEFINGQIHVKLAEEIEHVRYEDAVIKIKSILTRMNQLQY